MQDIDAVRSTLRLTAASFAIGAIVVVVVFSSLDLGDAERPDLADGAALAAAILGAIGLLIALQWWSRAGEQPRTPASLQTGFIIRVAVAELGLLLGIVGLYMTGSASAALIGLGFFLISLLLLMMGANRVVDV